jgi:hypothetical protein
MMSHATGIHETKGEAGVTTTFTSEERLGHADQDLQELKNGFVEAIAELHEHPEVDGSFHERLGAINRRLEALREELRPEDLDKAQLIEFHDALWEINRLMAEKKKAFDLDIIDRLLVSIERVRHVIRDALDEHVVGIPDDASLIIEELKGWLPNVSNETIATLVGVDRRTLTRWTQGHSSPSRQLQLVAHLVAILRHNWTEEGIVAWFQRSRRRLGGKKPALLLKDPLAEDLLLSEARGGRSQDA